MTRARPRYSKTRRGPQTSASSRSRVRAPRRTAHRPANSGPREGFLSGAGSSAVVARGTGAAQVFRQLAVVLETGVRRQRYGVRHTNLLSVHAWSSAAVRLKEGSSSFSSIVLGGHGPARGRDAPQRAKASIPPALRCGWCRAQHVDAPLAVAAAVEREPAAVGRPGELFGRRILEDALHRAVGHVHHPRPGAEHLEHDARAIGRDRRCADQRASYG